MRKTTRITAALGATVVAGLLASPLANAAEPKIIAGQTAEPVTWGAQVYLGGEFNCSGSVIAAQWVLTAQHCDGSNLSVKVGSNNLGSGQDATVDEVHPAANADLLLLHLSTPVSATPIQLGNADTKAGAQDQVYGWGRTKDNNPPSPVLKKATVKVTGKSTDAYGGPAIYSKGVDGAAWHGDSGGPEVNAAGQQVGVCSTGDNSGHDPNGTQNYASVANSRSWIKQVSGV